MQIRTKHMKPNHKSIVTLELATQIIQKDLCKGCGHCKGDDDNLICDVTNAKPQHNGACANFESDDQRLQDFISRLHRDMKLVQDKGVAWLKIGGSASVLLLTFLVSLHIESHPNWGIIVALTVVAVFVLAISFWKYVDARDKSHLLEISVVNSMAKLGNSKELPHRDITIELISEYLKEQGYAPQQYNDGIIFKYGDLNMIIDYSDGFLAIQVRYGLSDEDKAHLGTLSICADEYMKATQLIKVLIIDDAIIYIIEAHMLYMDELERYFERFAHWLSNANKHVITRYVKLKEPAFERIFIYSLAYRLIPLFVRCVSQKEVPISALWNEEAMKNELRNKDRYVNEAELTKFRVLSVSDYGEIKQVVYQFPEPQIAPEAKYGAVLVNTRTLECQYYTLEMSDNGLWFYCGVNENKQHLNYGEAKNSDLDSFLTWVLSDNKIIEAQSLTR